MLLVSLKIYIEKERVRTKLGDKVVWDNKTKTHIHTHKDDENRGNVRKRRHFLTDFTLHDSYHELSPSKGETVRKEGFIYFSFKFVVEISLELKIFFSN